MKTKHTYIVILAAVLTFLVVGMLTGCIILWRGTLYPMKPLTQLTAERIDSSTIVLSGTISSGNSALGYTRHTAEIEGNRLVIRLYRTLSIKPITFVQEGPVRIKVQTGQMSENLEIVLMCSDGELLVPFQN